MKIAKDGIRSIVKVGYDGRVHKTFRGTGKEERFKNEIRILKILENKGCNYVPRLLDHDDDTLTIVTTNCGSPAENSISKKKAEELFLELENKYGIIHDDPFPRNITYHGGVGKFFVIDFELSSIKEGSIIDEDVNRVLSWSGLTETAHNKKVNQDSMSAFMSLDGVPEDVPMNSNNSINQDGIIYVVSDGMGGASSGDIASEMIIRELRRFLPSTMGDFTHASNPEELLCLSIQDLHEYISRNGDHNKDLKGMGATIVCALFYRSRIIFANVGDSRIYRYRKGNLKQLTEDHTYLYSQYKSGKISEMQFRFNPKKNILQQAIGGGCQRVNPYFGSRNLEKGDWFLICSDGVIDGLWDKTIKQILKNADESGESAYEVSKNMLRKAVDSSGIDDTTLFIIKVER